MSLKLRVAARIREARLRRGLTQEALAERVDRSVDAISSLERGLALPGFETLEKLADALGMPMADFFDAAGEAEVSLERSRLLTAVIMTARQMEDADLTIAVELLEVLARHGPGARVQQVASE